MLKADAVSCCFYQNLQPHIYGQPRAALVFKLHSRISMLLASASDQPDGLRCLSFPSAQKNKPKTMFTDQFTKRTRAEVTYCYKTSIYKSIQQTDPYF